MAANPKLDKGMLHKMQMKTEIAGGTVNHPALSRVKQKLSEDQGISTDNPSMYSRMHHRHNRS